jgi:hypothetical protein
VSWAREFWLCDYTHWVSLKLDISENEWSKNLPMNGENGVHKRHMKTLLEGKTSHLPKTF